MKSMSFLDSIEVTSPCFQSWDSMQGNTQVRFCDHCVKHVHDLSAITRKEVRKLIARSQGGICVRYVRRPDGHIETLKRQLHQITRKTGIAAGVLGASLTASAVAYGQTLSPSDFVQNPPASELTARENSDGGGTISGVITDQNGAVITFAIVTIFNETGGIYQSVPTNMEGYYEFKNLPDGKYKLKVDASGFDSRDMGEVAISPVAGNKQDVQLSVSQFQEKVEVNGGRVEGEATVGLISGTYTEINGTSNKLIRAVQADDTEEVKRLIGMGKKVNVKNTYDEGNFPLHYAVEHGNFDIVQLLLNAGAKISAKNFNKRTPIMMIDEDTDADLVNLMLRFGADVHSVDKDKNTPLMLAASGASEAVVRVLILNGADLNAQNKKGYTALMLAAAAGNLENVKAILETGANAAVQSRKGETAWKMTSAEDIKQLLVSYGAVAQQP